MSINTYIQGHNAERIMRLVRAKLEAKGFTFDGEQCEAPKGMGTFAASEHLEKALNEAVEEAKRPALSVVPKD